MYVKEATGECQTENCQNQAKVDVYKHKFCQVHGEDLIIELRHKLGYPFKAEEEKSEARTD